MVVVVVLLAAVMVMVVVVVVVIAAACVCVCMCVCACLRVCGVVLAACVWGVGVGGGMYGVAAFDVASQPPLPSHTDHPLHHYRKTNTLKPSYTPHTSHPIPNCTSLHAH